MSDISADEAIRHVVAVQNCSHDRACLEIARRAAAGELRAFGSRRMPPLVWILENPPPPVEIEEIPAAVWSENITPGWFDDGLTWSGGTYYVDHFERSQFLALFSLTAAGEAPASDKPKKRGGGAKPKFDWDAVLAEIIRRADLDNLPGSRRQLTRDMLDWCGEQFGDVPGDTTMRDRIRNWVRHLPDD